MVILERKNYFTYVQILGVLISTRSFNSFNGKIFSYLLL